MAGLDLVERVRAKERDARTRDGARNLLSNCSGVKPGDKVLLVIEPPGLGHYDERMGSVVSDEVLALGAQVQQLSIPIGNGPEDAPSELFEAMAGADHTIFLSRIGDQVRFTALPGPGVKTMVHTLDLDALGAPFGHLPFGFLEAVHDLVVARLAAAESLAIRCPEGTDLTVSLAKTGGQSHVDNLVGFTLKTFPVMITPTIPADTLTGTLAASLALTSTAVHHYPDPVLPLPSPILLRLEAGCIVRIDGEPTLAQRVRAHLQRVAELVGGDPWTINSFHTGINPTTFFDTPALSDLERWTAVAFGSPRYTHFHMCGSNPGEISAKIFDPTITVDGEELWRDGAFAFLSDPSVSALAERFGAARSLLNERRSIGV